MKKLGSVFNKSFDSTKCKTILRLAIARLKVMKNQREVQLKWLKKELTKLLQNNQEQSAHIQVENIYREQNIVAAYEIIGLFCELIAVRLPIIESQRQCPIDVREAIASIIFAAPRCADVPELKKIRTLFMTKYGKEFTAVAAELRPDCGVNRVIIEKLSVRAPSPEMKLKLMKDITTELNVDWDSTAFEFQFLKPPEDLLDGPSHFIGASQMHFQTQPITEPDMGLESHVCSAQEPKHLSGRQFIPFIPRVHEDSPSSSQSTASHDSSHGSSISTTGSLYGGDVDASINIRRSLKDVAVAANVAAESAEQAAAAARAAAILARRNIGRNTQGRSMSGSNSSSDIDGDEELHFHASRRSCFHESVEEEGFHGGQTFWKDTSCHDTESVSQSVFSHGRFDVYEDDEESTLSTSTLQKPAGESSDRQWWDSRSSLSANHSSQHGFESMRTRVFRPAPSFDASDLDMKLGDEVGQPRIVPKLTKAASFVHPKLPDYDALTAQFKAMKAERAKRG